ncbi:GLE1-like protein [Ascoidea rubescens DSM 1968]|uniref:mRNA export factor GLE1 n=1 Tax=Ascoidea rubescens DSM 1968 TaxID=1344418 RepID=A0A1D2VJK2_9ASCO|nr:GLE1-like protein [Ascoidea rubescens DSM 1968]ODV61804.1 GLE1-like protein [Ascoidea rubescens DSM 1968]
MKKIKINPKFGQLTNSLTKLINIKNELIDILLNSKSNDPNSISFNWLLHFTSKCFIKQAETEIGPSFNSTLPLATLCYYVLIEIPEFRQIMMAKFIKKCPFIIGFTCPIDTENGRLLMGWKKPNKSSSAFESLERYNERVGGIFSLYAVLTRISLLRDPMYSNITYDKLPITINDGWTMVAKILNIQDESLITDTHFFILGNWWDGCATEFLNAFGRQAEKLLKFIAFEFTKNFIKSSPSALRLMTLGELWINENKIEIIPPMV